MKITDVQAHYLRLPDIQARTDSSQDALIVQVDTDAGVTGWGEVDGCPSVVKAIIEAPMSHTLVTGLKNLLIGEDPLDTSRLWQKMYQGTLYYGREGAVIQAMAGIDLAPDGKPGVRGFHAQRKLFEAGLHIKLTGDAAVVAPPLVAEQSHIDETCEILRKVFSRY